MMDPKTLKKWLIVVAVLYLVFPRDLIPDFFGRGLGFLDDVLLMAVLNYVYRRHLRDYAGRTSAESEQRSQREHSSRARAGASENTSDPYEILGIAEPASEQEIQAAYKARMKEYHPDKVDHLGEELQKLAHRKTLEIQQAYQKLRK